MARKLMGFHNAIGTWSNPWRRIEAQELPASVRVWLQDKLVARGRVASLYTPVDDLTPGVVACTCVKQTTASSQRQCDSCFGVKLIPGYLKFGHQTLFFASAESSNFTLVDTVLSTITKPHTLQLPPAALTGSAITQDKPFANPQGANWEFHADTFIRDAGSSITVDFSTDSGTSWNAIADLNGTAKPIGTGTIRFRLTLTRSNINDASPVVEILRIRRAEIENVNTQLLRQRRDLSAGHILILKTWAVEKSDLIEGRGREILHLGDRSWTAPLDFFDKSVERDTPAARITDAGSGPHPFIEYADGVQALTRYALEQISYNTQLGIFTHSAFAERRLQENEPYSLVW